MSAGAPRARIAVVDDDPVFRESTAELLRQDGYDVVTAADAVGAVETLDRAPVDLVLLDLCMPGIDGLALVEVLRQRGERVPILMISGYGTVDVAVQALHLGTDDFLTKPVEPDVLSARVAALLERRPNTPSPQDVLPEGLVGRSAAMRAVAGAIRRVAPTMTTVLITGETGTGKELVARAIHALSPRRHAPFIAVNCGALALGVLESELFGHMRGAFTGAVRDRAGAFESAAGGTIFLDEVGDLDLVSQQRLLRVLQEREVTPVGSSRPIRVDVRVIAATNRDLQRALVAERFRPDLFYRLNVFAIALPALRERRSDIPVLVDAALRALARSRDRVPRACSPFAMRLLQALDWPGNVRELFAAIESATLVADGPRLEAHHLPAHLRSVTHGSAAGDPERYRASQADEDERGAIIAALAAAGGVRAQAAELLGMGRTTLWRKLRKYGLAAEAAADDEGDHASGAEQIISGGAESSAARGDEGMSDSRHR